MQRSIRTGAMMLAAALVLSACFDRGGSDDEAQTPTPEIAGEDADQAADPEPEADDEAVGDGSDGSEDPEPDTADEPEAQDDGPSTASADLADGPVEACADLSGFTEVDATSLTDELIATLDEPSGAFRADAELNPLTKAVLLVDASEAELPRTRYRLRYAMVAQDADPSTSVDIVLIERFNLGPAVRDELLEAQDESTVGPVEEFGVGPNVAYCFQMQTVQALTADVLAASRAEFDDATAAGASCLGSSCTDTAPILEEATDWEDGEQLTFPATVYEPLREGAPGPAVALDLALTQSFVASVEGGEVRWHGFERREGLAAGEPFVEVVADVGLGQDAGVDLALREGHLMDDMIETAWQRVMGVAGGADAPLLFSASAVEEREHG